MLEGMRVIDEMENALRRLVARQTVTNVDVVYAQEVLKRVDEYKMKGKNVK